MVLRAEYMMLKNSITCDISPYVFYTSQQLYLWRLLVYFTLCKLEESSNSSSVFASYTLTTLNQEAKFYIYIYIWQYVKMVWDEFK